MAMDMFLKIEPVKGESVDKKHKGEIDVLAWSWGMSNSGTTHSGGGGGAGKVNVQDLSITKWLDKGSTDLQQACCKGQHFDTATLVVRKSGGDTPIEYLTITMSEVMVTAVSTGGSGGEDRLTENVTLNFAKVKFAYAPQAKTGAKGGDKEFVWDIAGNADK
jgi:type VI secretion system secreted protein Hcp